VRINLPSNDGTTRQRALPVATELEMQNTNCRGGPRLDCPARGLNLRNLLLLLLLAKNRSLVCCIGTNPPPNVRRSSNSLYKVLLSWQKLKADGLKISYLGVGNSKEWTDLLERVLYIAAGMSDTPEAPTHRLTVLLVTVGHRMTLKPSSVFGFPITRIRSESTVLEWLPLVALRRST
jgi:hypothetical protein